MMTSKVLRMLAREYSGMASQAFTDAAARIDELEAANEVAAAAITLTDPVIDKLTRERDEADAYIIAIWRRNLLPSPMGEPLLQRLMKK